MRTADAPRRPWLTMRTTDPRRRAGTVGQRWRRRRDLVIALAWRAGASERLLAEVFDLTRSRVQAIVAALAAEAGAGKGAISDPAGPRP
jgi:hypothetical protein